MKFSTKLFEDDIVPSLDTPYVKEHSGAFYDVYEDENGGLHMDRWDEESLRERLYFYQTHLAKERFPIYLDGDVSLEDPSLEEQTFAQALGLPLVALTRTGKNGKRFYISPSEVLGRITFEEHLHHGYGSLPSSLGDNVLLGDSYSVIGAMNHLIANGIFLQNLDRILSPSRENGMYYPVHIHEEKLPEKIRNEKETGEKLFMDFCSSPLSFDKKSYLRTYGRIDSMSLEEQAQIAFEDIASLKDEQEKELRLSLRRYFLSAAREIVAEFYQKEYHCSFLSPSLLSHKICHDNFLVGDIYSGSVFSMLSLRSFTVTESNKGAKLTEEHSPYLLKEDDLKKLKNAYEIVRKYFNRHPELCYLPQIFLKLMGLPYPAFEAAKYFDFARGNFKQLVHVIGVTPVSLLSSGYQETILTSDGVLIDPVISGSPVANVVFYHNQSLPSCYLSNPMLFFAEGEMDFLCFWGKQNRNLYQFFSGNVDFINPLLSLDSWLKETPVESGNYTIIRSFFSYLNEGYSAMEAYSILSEQIKVDRVMFFYFIMALICFLLGNSANQYLDKLTRHAGDMSKSDFQIHVIHPDKTEECLLVDRNFVFLYHPDQEPCYSLPKSDYDIFEKVNRNYKKFYDGLYALEDRGHVYYYYTLFDKIGMKQREQKKYLLPDLDKKSIFEDEKWTKIIDGIPELTSIRAFRTAISRGILIPGDVSGYHPFIPSAKKRTDKRLSALLDYDFIRMVFEFEAQRKTGNTMRSDSSFLKDCLDDYFEYAYIAPDTSDDFQNLMKKLALYYCEMVEGWYLDDLKGKDTLSPFHPIEESYQGKTRYKMLGQLFDAYSNSKDFDSFYLLKKDKKQLVKVINSFYKLEMTCFDVADRIRNAPFFTGLPIIFLKKLRNLYSNENHVTERTLDKYFTFREEEENVTDDYVDENYQWKKNSLSTFYCSPKLKRKLMGDGLVLYYDTDLFDFNLFQFRRDEHGYWDYPFYKLNCHVLENLTGDVKTYLEPNEALLSEMIHNFKLHAECHDVDYEALNDACLTILTGCKEDTHFLSYLLNDLQDTDNSLHSYSRYYVLKKNIDSISKDTRSFLEHAYVISFLLFLERNIILAVGKKIVEG